jgi:sporulation protein YlmC with PRC-barrel domain
MLVPFGTKVVDTDGKAVGSLKHLVLDPQSRQVVGCVVHHGLVHRLEVVVPLSKVAAFGEEVRLALHADEIDDLQLFHAPHFQVMPDHWEMPLGFDQRDFFLDAETVKSLEPSR